MKTPTPVQNSSGIFTCFHHTCAHVVRVPELIDQLTPHL
jgi:hypothetical protein